MKTIEKIGIVYHPKNEPAYALALKLKESIIAKGFSVWVCSAWQNEELKCKIPPTDLVITTGGNGTILRTAQVASINNTPIAGINLGKIGFMTEVGATNAQSSLNDMISGKGWLDKRAMLKAELHSSSEKKLIFHALNDVVVTRGSIARIIDITVSIDNQPLISYKSDGVIVATATGSTGYALAASGPILHPSAKDFVLVPILPHLNPTYSLVIPSDSETNLKLSTNHEATLCIDGHINHPLSDGDIIKLSRSRRQTRFLRLCSKNTFYSTLGEKLRGNYYLDKTG